MAALSRRIYAAGGFTRNGRASAVVEVYDPGANAWSPSVPLPEPLHHAGLVGARGRLYIIGGYTQSGQASRGVWSWGPGSPRWRAEPDLPTRRGALATAVVSYAGREWIHAVGGASRFGADTRLVPAHEVFDATRRRWTKAAPLPRPRDHLAAAGAEGRLYVTGGRELSLAANKRWLDSFDPASGNWRRERGMPTARGGLAAASVGRRIFVFGGEQPSGTFEQAEVYDISDREWSSAPDMPTSRHGLGAATIGNRIYVVGGGPVPGLSVSGANEVLAVG